MSQSALLVSMLAAGFLLYVAARGRLPAYASVLWGPAQSSGGGGGGGGVDAEDAAKVALKVLPYVI